MDPCPLSLAIQNGHFEDRQPVKSTNYFDFGEVLAENRLLTRVMAVIVAVMVVIGGLAMGGILPGGAFEGGILFGIGVLFGAATLWGMQRLDAAEKRVKDKLPTLLSYGFWHLNAKVQEITTKQKPEPAELVDLGRAYGMKTSVTRLACIATFACILIGIVGLLYHSDLTTSLGFSATGCLLLLTLYSWRQLYHDGKAIRQLLQKLEASQRTIG